MDPVVGLGNHSLDLSTTTKPDPGVLVVSLRFLACAQVCGERCCAAVSDEEGAGCGLPPESSDTAVPADLCTESSACALALTY